MVETQETHLLCCKSDETEVLSPIQSSVLGKVAIYNLQCQSKTFDAVDLMSEITILPCHIVNIKVSASVI